MRASLRSLLLFLALSAALTLAFACGDDDSDNTLTPSDGPPVELTLVQYFRALDMIFERADTESDAAQAELDAGLDADAELEEEIAVVDEYLDKTIATFTLALDDIGRLGAPATVQADQATFVAAAEEARSLSTELKGNLESVETREEADELVAEFNSASSILVAQGDEACVALQAVADDNSVDVDLECAD